MIDNDAGSLAISGFDHVRKMVHGVMNIEAWCRPAWLKIATPEMVMLQEWVKGAVVQCLEELERLPEPVTISPPFSGDQIDDYTQLWVRRRINTPEADLIHSVISETIGAAVVGDANDDSFVLPYPRGHRFISDWTMDPDQRRVVADRVDAEAALMFTAATSVMVTDTLEAQVDPDVGPDLSMLFPEEYTFTIQNTGITNAANPVLFQALDAEFGLVATR